MTEKDVDIVALARTVETLQNDTGVNGLVLQKIQVSISELTEAVRAQTAAIGSTWTDEHGTPVGTGIKGDLMRIRLAGAIMAASVAVTVVWWLVQERVEFLK